jgi:hypothetical protein
MTETDGMLRARALEAYEAIPSLDAHGEMTRLILAEVSLLTAKYRHVRRHDVPHIKELSGLLDVLWQEVEMELAEAGVVTDPRTEVESLPLFGSTPAAPARDKDQDAHTRPAFRL